MSDSPFKDAITATPEGARLWREEKTLLEITEAIWGEMKRQGVSIKELAERLGVTRRILCNRMDGYPDISVRFLAQVVHALECEATVTIRKEEPPQ